MTLKREQAGETAGGLSLVVGLSAVIFSVLYLAYPILRTGVDVDRRKEGQAC